MRRLALAAALALALPVMALPFVALAQPQGEPGGGEPAAEHGEHGEHHGIDWNLMIWQIIDFSAVVFVVVYFGRKPLARFLTERRAGVAEALEEAQRLKAAAEAREKELRERLVKLNDEMAALRADMVKAGVEERDRIVADAEEKAARMRKETEFVIEQQLKQLRVDLTKEAVDAAITAAQEVLSSEASAADQERLGKLYLAELAAAAAKEKRA
jgi:F-type H+-transporting ATPase subunit b